MTAPEIHNTGGPAAVQTHGLVRRVSEGGVEREILRGVDLRLERGEFVALLGRSGSGKSTLLNLLGGLDAPDEGEIWIDDQRVDTLDETARTVLRRRRIGFVFQAFNLVPTLTVLENVLLPLELDGRADRAARARARELLVDVGLGDRADSFPDRLSGGEQQRVAVARALAGEPALVLADEPTGNLDHETGNGVLDLLERLVRERGVTLLVVTHSAEAAGRADRALEMDDGRLVGG
ncbi:ABC transporter ATP-binding protein [Engelhardtia mirabilis]|uniref:Putative ABC transporter ATP-binding protein n=1 Tax=Engelhardtia mirabilis TaxID=2528011 RepID=A0A518BHW9_9BACT|nr:putative ABC transporter ATP-binding protein [Planctomycetes bacterium Pla133]QDV00904.1 putative ABC transporter ATP-binding protein [Planctomycetes bacterium Pla86]